MIECGIDHRSGDMAAPNPIHASNLQECIWACDARDGCRAAALSGSACYLKGSVGVSVYNGVNGEVLVHTVSATSSTTTPVPTSTGATQALGCFIDEGARILQNQAYSSSSNTPDLCATTCSSEGYKYSGVEYGSECWCGNDFPSGPTSSSDCSFPCPGNSNQKCGARGRMNVASDSTWQQTLFVRETFSTWSMMSCYRAIIPNGASEAGDRTMPISLIAAAGKTDQMSVAKCLGTCQDRGYDYCGLEWAGNCWASDSSPSPAALIPGYPLNDSVGCNHPCGGNATESCGGWAKVLVYVNNGTMLPLV